MTHPSTAKTAVTVMWPIRMLASAEVSRGGVVRLTHHTPAPSIASTIETKLKVWEWKMPTPRHWTTREELTERQQALDRNLRSNQKKNWFNTRLLSFAFDPEISKLARHTPTLVSKVCKASVDDECMAVGCMARQRTHNHSHSTSQLAQLQGAAAFPHFDVEWLRQYRVWWIQSQWYKGSCCCCRCQIF